MTDKPPVPKEPFPQVIVVSEGQPPTWMLKSNASSPQPSPMPGKQRVLDVVINDLQERAESGRTKYGTYLETHNGRDPLWDAYQEAVDLVMYLRQVLLEKGEEGVCYTDDIDPVWSSNQVVTILIIAGVIGFVIGLLAG